MILLIIKLKKKMIQKIMRKRSGSMSFKFLINSWAGNYKI